MCINTSKQDVKRRASNHINQLISYKCYVVKKLSIICLHNLFEIAVQRVFYPNTIALEIFVKSTHKYMPKSQQKFTMESTPRSSFEARFINS